jgi:hypothetical protein
MTKAKSPAPITPTATVAALPPGDGGQAKRFDTATPNPEEVAMPRNNQGTCAVLHRQDFINDEHVEAFCEEVAAAITTPQSSRLHARVFPHQYFDRDHGHTRTFSKFDDALTQYNWDGQTFVQTEVKLRNLADELRKAGEAADTNQNTLSTLVACFNVLDWGGGGALRSSNVDWLVKNIVPGSPLGDLLRDAVGALGDGNRNRDANLSGFRRDTYRSNAGFTKIYSLLSENTFVIYDSRVAAALGMLIANWCAETGRSEVPDHLRLHWMPAKEGPNADTKVRDPSLEIFRFPKLTGTTVNFNHAASNVRANWIVELVLKKIAKKTSWTARKIEAALFMIGYDLGNR